jgi:excisionase family DNA binding protein
MQQAEPKGSRASGLMVIVTCPKHSQLIPTLKNCRVIHELSDQSETLPEEPDGTFAKVYEIKHHILAEFRIEALPVSVNDSLEVVWDLQPDIQTGPSVSLLPCKSLLESNEQARRMTSAGVISRVDSSADDTDNASTSLRRRGVADMEDRLRSIQEASERLGVSTFTTRRLIKAGSLKAVRISKRVLVAESEVERAITQGCGKHLSKA